MATLDPIPYADSVEVPPSDEAEDIRLAIQSLERILRQSREQSGQYVSPSGIFDFTIVYVSSLSTSSTGG